MDLEDLGWICLENFTGFGGFGMDLSLGHIYNYVAINISVHNKIYG